MADASTIARPYAKAVFETAMESGQFEAWGHLLAGLGEALDDPRIEVALSDPKLGSETIAGIIIEALGGSADQQAQNFIRLLAEYDRLYIVEHITVRFEALRAEAERIVDVEVVSAAPLSDEHRQQLTNALRTRLGREVRLHSQLDESLIGGAVIRAGDLVIDGSLRGRLDQLTSAVKA